jgi:hypothetical protein
MLSQSDRSCWAAEVVGAEHDVAIVARICSEDIAARRLTDGAVDEHIICPNPHTNPSKCCNEPKQITSHGPHRHSTQPDTGSTKVPDGIQQEPKQSLQQTLSVLIREPTYKRTHCTNQCIYTLILYTYVDHAIL